MGTFRISTLQGSEGSYQINRAHTFTDLLCTVDVFEDKLLGAIDGKRTLAAILPHVANDESAERRAIGFFERLWHYDPVVFDASLAAIPTP